MASGYNNPSEFQEELATASGGRMTEGLQPMSAEDEDDIARQMEEEDNSKRNDSRLQQIKDSAKNKALNKAKKELGKDTVKFMARQGAATGVRSGLVWALSSIGGVLLAIIALIAAFIMLIMLVKYTCEQDSSWKGKIARSASYVASSRPGKWLGLDKYNICGKLDAFSTVKQNQLPVVPTPQAAPAADLDLVPISGIPTSGSGDWRLRSCMLRRVQIIYSNAQAVGIDFVITSAYRPGAVVTGTGRASAHSRGEAVDLVIVPRDQRLAAMTPAQRLADPAFQRLVSRLVQISINEGFYPQRGDTLDEYNRPTEGATGGHVHIEFNTAPSGGSYCGIAN
jgi:hypothetical protein